MALKQVLMCSLLALAVASPAPIIEASDSYCTIWKDASHSGAGKNVTSYIPDLNATGFDNAVSSVCITGLWYFYDLVRYNTDYKNQAMYWSHGIDYCFNITDDFENKASSVRYGQADVSLDQSSFTLYDYEWYEGDEIKSAVNVTTFGAMNGRGSALVVTGPSSWTFYTGENYNGTAVCVTPDTVDTQGDRKLHVILVGTFYPTYENNLRSAHLGCNSENVLKSDVVVGHQAENGAMGYFNNKRN